MLDKTKERIGEFIVEKIRGALYKIGIKKFSKLYKSVQVKETSSGFNILINEYYENVEKGRKKYAKRVPIKAIEDWVKRYLVLLPPKTVVERIYRNGIKPRPFSKKAMEDIDRELDAILSNWIYAEL